MAGYIDSIDETSPLITENPADFPAEMREFKNKVKISFPNVAGAVSATDTELNYTDVTTVGTAQASKVVTADANVDTTGQRNITATGTITAPTITTTTQSAGDNSTNAATTAYVDRHPYIPLQRFRDAQGTNFSTGSTNYTRVSDEYTITPTEANTKLEGYFVVNCRVTNDNPASTTSATASFKAGYRNSSGTGIDFGSTQSLYIYEQGDFNSRAVQGSMTIPFSVSSSQVDASGNWDLHVRGKVSGADDTLDTLLTYLVAEEFIE